MESYKNYVFQLEQKTNAIDELTNVALQSQDQHLSNKYCDIIITLKALKSMINKFVKRADSFEKNLRKTSRIQDIIYMTDFHQKRVDQCLALSTQITKNIEIKRQQIKNFEQKVSSLRKTLFKLKTDNILIMLTIDNIQQKIVCQQNLENCNKLRKQKQLRKTNDRGFITQKGFKDPLLSIKQEKKQMEINLFEKIDSKIKIYHFFQQCYYLLRQKLVCRQKKSTVMGLTGSLFFKLQKQQKPKYSARVSDSKLLIFDVLKRKYDQFQEQQNSFQQNFTLSKKEFLNFSPLQIAGIIELRGGISKVYQKKLTLSKNVKQINS